MHLTIDFETRSTVDLTKSGPWVYGEDKTTDVMVVAFQRDDEPPQYWIPPRFAELAEAAGLSPAPPEALEAELERAAIIEAHNVEFERAVWHWIMHRRLGWPDLPFDKLRCSAAKAAYHCLPRSLGQAGEVIGLDVQKDDEGRKIMLRMCKPLPNGEWHEDPADFRRLVSYCQTDVQAERALSQALRDLPPEELRIWRLDQQINARGMMLDRAGILRMIALVRAEQARLSEALAELTDNEVSGPARVEVLRTWLEARVGETIPCLDKGTVADLLERDDLPDTARRALEIRKAYAHSSTAKFSAMLRSIGQDDRARGTSMYHGAGTGRDTGRRLQPLNFPRGTLKPSQVEDVYRMIERLDALGAPPATIAAEVGTQYGPPLETASSCLRGALVAAPGARLIAADYTAIEGRVLAWLAGEETTLEDYRAGRDPYIVAAVPIYDTPYEEIERRLEAGDPWAKQCRTVGKPSDLAFGYGGGIGAYRTFASAYRVDVSGVAQALRSKVTPEQIEKAERMASWFLTRHPGAFTHEEALGADLAKQLWREAHPWTVQWWRELEDAAHAAVQRPGTPQRAGPVDMIKPPKEPFLYLRLPSGRLLHYYHPTLKVVETDWGEKLTLFYMSVNSQTRKWSRTHTYGGKLAENVTQAVARDVFYRGAQQLDAAGYPIVLRVYDEIVAEVPEGRGSVAEFCDLMATNPPWALDLPLAAAGWEGARYRKD